MRLRDPGLDNGSLGTRGALDKSDVIGFKDVPASQDSVKSEQGNCGGGEDASNSPSHEGAAARVRRTPRTRQHGYTAPRPERLRWRSSIEAHHGQPARAQTPSVLVARDVQTQTTRSTTAHGDGDEPSQEAGRKERGQPREKLEPVALPGT